MSENIEALIVKYLNGSISKEEHRQLTEWIGLSGKNQRMFDQIREVWMVSLLKNESLKFDYQAAFNRFKDIVRKEKPIPRFREIKKRPGAITLPYRWVAAIAIMAVIGGAFLSRLIFSASDSETAYQEITVPYGARSRVLLPDGSHVTLNAGTTLRYHVTFGKDQRDLWLDGEGYFVVQKSQAPFIVHSGSVEITAIGTQFNVRAYSSENNIETTLVKGEVAIKNISYLSNTRQEVTLLPNQKLTIKKEYNNIAEETVVEVKEDTIIESVFTIDPKGNDMIIQENIDPLPDISWKDNQWVIYRESLEDLAVKLERRYDIRIRFNDNHLKSFRYNGTLPDESLEQVLRVMSLVSPIKYEVNGKVVTFYENKKFKK